MYQTIQLIAEAVAEETTAERAYLPRWITCREETPGGTSSAILAFGAVMCSLEVVRTV